MSYLVLARKYRPATFDEIIGQEHVTRTLRNAIDKNKIHHAFLFTGTRGVGKTTSARVLAKALCCQSTDGPTPEPCGECAACKSIAVGQAVDVNEIDGASNNSVNDIRDLRDNVMYRPQQTRFKIYIIDEVHMLSTPAFNALLKTLEEPPEHVKFIFATTESHKIPQTILSRCQRYDFKAVSAARLYKLFAGLCEREGVTASEAALQIVARMARGSVRDGLSLLDAVLAYAGETVTDDDVRLVLGVADAAIFARIVAALIARDAAAAFDAVADLVDYGHDLRQFGSDFLEYLRDCVLVASAPRAAQSLTRPEGEINELVEFSKQAELGEWIAWFDLMVEGQERIARSEQARYMLELTLAKMLQVGKLRPIDELLAGLGKLAKSGGLSTTRSAPPAPAPGGPRNQAAEPQAAPIHIDDYRAARAGDPGDESPPPPERMASDDPVPQVSEPPANWAELVNRVRERERALWAKLMKMGVIDFGEDCICLEAPAQSLGFKEFGNAEGKRRLSELFSSILGRRVAVEVQPGEGGTQAVSLDDTRKQREKENNMKAKRNGMNDPTVLEIRKVFGGGEVMVKPLEKKRAGSD